jgi:hypothetical protein
VTVKVYWAPPGAVPSPDEYQEITDVAAVAKVLKALDEAQACEEPRSPGKRGPRPRPAALARSRKLEVASLFIVFAVVADLPYGRALKSTMEHHGLGKRTVKKCIAFARAHDDGKWWPRVCELAAKRKGWPQTT